MDNNVKQNVAGESNAFSNREGNDVDSWDNSSKENSFIESDQLLRKESRSLETVSSSGSARVSGTASKKLSIPVKMSLDRLKKSCEKEGLSCEDLGVQMEAKRRKLNESTEVPGSREVSSLQASDG